MNPSVTPPPSLTSNELLKLNDPTLAGTIAETLADPAQERFSDDDEQFLKFHAIYQQDDRDKRKTGKQYLYLIRARLPGGVVPATQYLAFDELARLHGNDTLRLTSRQSFQWHGVVKNRLGALMRGLHEALCTTIAACGDVGRNVMAPPTPSTSPLVDQVQADALKVDALLVPRTPSYHEIWVDGTPLKLTAGEKQAFEDPLYGRQYLPRKFKVAFAIPPLNDTDIYTHCLGFVAVADPADPARLLGYNVLVGGGLGMSHGNAKTYPRVADALGFVPPERILDVTRAVLQAYRDAGDRTNRKHARLKYVIAERGVDWFRSEVEQRAGLSFAPVRPVVFSRQSDVFGWHRQRDGRWFLGLYVEAGRIADRPGRQLKTALRRVATTYAPQFRVTPSQNLLLTDVAEADRAGVTALLAEQGIPVENQAAAVRRTSMACVSLPTCPLALAESERALPGILDRFEATLSELGLGEEPLHFRMTGCPNGCARPYLAEIALVGRAPGKYALYLGGNVASTRLNREYRNAVKLDEFFAELRTLLVRWQAERQPTESFGDWAHRTLWPEPAATVTA